MEKDEIQEEKQAQGEDSIPLSRVDGRSGYRVGLLLAILAFLLAAIGIGFAYYFYEKEIKPVLNASASRQDVDQINTVLKQQSTQLESMGHEVDRAHSDVTALRTTMSSERSNLLLAQVEHLLEIANDRLKFMQDVTTASSALMDAEERLSAVDEPKFNHLAATVRTDLQRLNEYEDVDADKVLANLSDLVERLRPLPTVDDEDADTDTGSEQTESAAEDDAPEQPQTAEPGLENVWQNLKDSISSQVRVVDNEDPVSTFSVEAINRYKLDVLRLRVEAMRLSLIRHDLPAFNAEIADAQAWIIENMEEKLAQPLLTELLRLRRLELKRPPDVGRSLQEVRNLLAAAERAQGDARIDLPVEDPATVGQEEPES